MDFEPTEEQRLLADALTDLLTTRYAPNMRLDLLTSELGWSRDVWKQFADMGLLGLAFDPAHGGAGMGPAELGVVMECLGRALVLEPFVPTVILGGGLVLAAGTDEQKAAILPGIAAGDRLLAFAATEPGRRWALDDPATKAEAAGDGWRLTGVKTAVLGADCADTLIVSASTPSGTVGLFLVGADDVDRDVYAFQDGQRGADVRLDGAPAALLGNLDDKSAAIESVVDLATVMLCAEAVGAMERMLWMTVDYLKTRVQFGHPISQFQALQFRAADMYVSLVQARSMAMLAQLALTGPDSGDRATTIRAAKIQIDLSSRHVAQEAVQLHGGIGMTMEYPLGHYLKRTTVIAKTFSDTGGLIDRVGRAGGLVTATS